MILRKIKKTISKNKIFLVFISLAVLIRIILSFSIYSGDVNNHISWGKDISENGISGVYEREFIKKYKTMTPTYPPIPLLAFTYSYKLYNFVYKLSWDLNNKYSLFPSNLIFFLEDQDSLPAFHKIFAILTDIGLAVVVYKFFVKKQKKITKKAIIFSNLILFNPGLMYSSSYWGQIESAPIFFLLLSFYLLFNSKNKFLPAVVFSLALLTKQTSIIFIPIFSIAYFWKNGFLTSFKGFVYSILTFFIIFLPFYGKGSIITYPFRLYWNKIQTGSGSDYVTDHAFNFWSLITGLGKIHDNEIFYLFSYRTWGFLIFFLLYLVILYVFIKVNKQKEKYFYWALSLISLSAFLFLTRMHSRYIALSIPFLLLSGFYNKKILVIFVFVSFYKLINMYHNWWAPRVDFLVNMIDSKLFIDTITIILIGLFSVFLIKYLKDYLGFCTQNRKEQKSI